ncbi:MAG TPA: type VI secretion system baseplate subunit TssF [Gemmatimonadaceae bacterium]|jgi:type VI secretion system protein ImpG
MREDLLHYYERELAYVRRMGAEFAQRYPKIASRLQLEPNKCEDPHVERVIEAFAFLAARVHLKIDDDFPEVTESVLNIVYPHYIRPIPSMSIAELRIDVEQGVPPNGFHVPRGTALYSRPVDGVPCKFRTCYDTTLWPFTVTAAQWMTPDRLKPAARLGDAVAALRIELRCLPGMTFSQLDLTTLRLFLNGDSNIVYPLYELLANNRRDLVIREIGVAKPKSITLEAEALQPAGFAHNEGMLPYPGRSFQAYRLLQEYFAFPEKYLFYDLGNLRALREAGMGSAIEIIIPIGSFERAEWRQMLEASVNQQTIRLGCTPIVNLFSQVAEPLLVNQRRHEYMVVPDAHRRVTTEVFSVESVVAVSPDSGVTQQFEPLYSHRHGSTNGHGGSYWLARRRFSGWRSDVGTDVMLSFVDLSGRVVFPEFEVVTARLTCFNSDLPSRLPFGNERGDFELERGGPVKAIVALVKPTRVVQPPLGTPQIWRLISQLSLNYLSLTDSDQHAQDSDGSKGTDALREVLRLHDFSGEPAVRRQIEGVLGVKSAPAFARIATEHGLSFARGRRVELELDEEQFTGAGAYLFASVLEHFFGLYASINSFSTLTARSRQRKGGIREWPPRAGWKPLL